jgi:C1A family cysteine protease
MIATAMPPRTKRILTALVTLLLFLPASASLALDLETVQEAIRLSGARWEAADTDLSRLTLAEKKRLLGLLPEPDLGETPNQTLFRAGVTAPLPTRLDWRDFEGDNYVTPARAQGNCGSCWAFAAVGALESYVMLRTHQPGMDIDLAEQSLLSCETEGGCGGGSGWTAATILRDNGVPNEACLPYAANDTLDCSNRCSGWEQQAQTISSFRQVIGYTGQMSQAEIVAALKTYLASHGPLWTTMQVYEDFYNYQSGIYTYTTGNLTDGHAILLIGYDDAAEAFTAKNSWGARWPNNNGDGSFRIAYSQVANDIEFGAYTYIYGDPVDVGQEAPTADAGDDQRVDENEVVTLDGSASSDPDGEIETYAWHRLRGPAVTLSDAASPRPSFTTPNFTTAADADIVFELTVTDDDGLSSTDTVTVTVTWANDPPVARAGEDRSVAEGESVQLDGASSEDLEGEIARYQWQKISGPDLSMTSVDTPRTSFTTPNLTTAADAECVFRLTVTDAHGATDSDWVKITVTWENDPPTARAGEDRSVDEGARVQLDASASEDTEGQISQYQWRKVSGPDVTLTDGDTSQASFSAPNLTAAGDAALVFELTVTDEAGDTATDTVAITVTWTNDAPTAVAGQDQNVAAGDAVTLDASASSDPDDGIDSYAWTQVAGPDVQLTTQDEAQTGFTAPVNTGSDPLQLRFEVAVSDGGGLTATDSVDIWIAPQPDASGGDPQEPSDPTDPQDPGDDQPPVDEPKDTPEPDVNASGGGGGGGCFISFSWWSANQPLK